LAYIPKEKKIEGVKITRTLAPLPKTKTTYETNKGNIISEKMDEIL
jgi:hypothetical protein